jgi:thioester reductase-like protein
MNKAIGDLSAKEKRALLAELLEGKLQAQQGRPATDERHSILGEFAISVEDLSSEAVLDPEIRPANGAPATRSHDAPNIFLTGATGFLGAFILDELVRNTGSRIYCLVRCTDASDGERRIKENYQKYLQAAEYPASRVTVIPGDLSKHLFGLSNREFETLAAQIEVIYHNGAYINWLYSYKKLKPTNVLGTQEVLRFACQGRAKPLHYVSTLAVFSLVGDPNGKVIPETEPLDHSGVLYGGYTQSKWVAEKLVVIARSRGLPVTIYRPGLITGDSRTGAWNADDVLSKMMRSWVEMGSVPEMDAATDMTPVDYVSRALVYLSRRAGVEGRVFHLVNQNPVHLGKLVAGIRSLGFELQQLSYEEWRAKMVSMTKISGKQLFSSLAPFFNGGKISAALKGLRQSDYAGFGNTLDSLGNVLSLQYATRSVSFGSEVTLEALAGSGIACPNVDGDLLKRYFAYFSHKGLFRPAHQVLRGTL